MPKAEVAVIRSVELIVQPDAKDAAGVVASGPAKRIIIENSLPRPTSSGRTERRMRCNRELSWDLPLRRGTSAPIQIAVRCVIGVLVAPVVIAATEPEASATMKMIAVDVAARLGMQTRKAATESHATTGEMASAKAAAHARRHRTRRLYDRQRRTRPRVHLHLPRRRAQTRRRSVPR